MHGKRGTRYVFYEILLLIFFGLVFLLRAGVYYYANYLYCNEIFIIGIYFVAFTLLTIFMHWKCENIGVLLQKLVVIFLFLGIIEVIAQFVFPEQSIQFVQHLKNIFENHEENKSEITELQLRLECCGVYSHHHYTEKKLPLPPSCCQFSLNLVEFTCVEKDVYGIGCLEKLLPITSKASYVRIIIPTIVSFMLECILIIISSFQKRNKDYSHVDGNDVNECSSIEIGENKVILNPS